MNINVRDNNIRECAPFAKFANIIDRENFAIYGIYSMMIVQLGRTFISNREQWLEFGSREATPFAFSKRPCQRPCRYTQLHSLNAYLMPLGPLMGPGASRSSAALIVAATRKKVRLLHLLDIRLLAKTRHDIGLLTQFVNGVVSQDPNSSRCSRLLGNRKYIHPGCTIIIQYSII